MTQYGTTTPFALSGVIGIVDQSMSQIELAANVGLRCVEIRADLLRSGGLSDQEIIDAIVNAKAAGLASLYTLRHADQGGHFNEDEQLRIALCSQALDAGVDVIDLEHGTVASTHLLQQSAPMILSYHNFNGMLSQAELSELSDTMERQSPAAVKIIPTGDNLSDAATMMNWVSGGHGEVARIGFTMGAAGAVSRILALSVGSPVTYASFGEPVAPGQVDIAQLLDQYRCQHMNLNTKVIGLLGTPENTDRYIKEHQQTLAQSNCVCVPFPDTSEKELQQLKQSMNISEIVIV